MEIICTAFWECRLFCFFPSVSRFFKHYLHVKAGSAGSYLTHSDPSITHCVVLSFFMTIILYSRFFIVSLPAVHLNSVVPLY